MDKNVLVQSEKAIKSSPIIFQPWKVSKILGWDFSTQGNMQTRRLAGLERFNEKPDQWKLCSDGWLEALEGACGYETGLPFCRYGGAGDLLWVRERFMITYPSTAPDGDPWCAGEPTEYIGRLPHEKPTSLLDNWWDIHYYADNEMQDGWKWRPSIFMPKWASRINLEIVSTRLERLQDITVIDSRAEGVESSEWLEWANTPGYSPGTFNSDLRVHYGHVWDKINGYKAQNSWKSNPWVRVIEYKLNSN
jgi:hypothetical protein